MKTWLLNLLSVVFVTMILGVYADAQQVEDALRLSGSSLSIGARSLGAGGAYTAISDDYNGIFWNPAGLGQMRSNEVSFGLSSLNFGNTSTFYNNDQSLNNSATNLNSFGLVYSVPTTQGSFVVALGYGRYSEFTTGLSFKGFNPYSSITQLYAPDGQTTNDPHGNLIWEVFLANADSLSPNLYRWDSRIKDSVTQSGTTLEGGGQNYYSLAGGVEAAKNVFLGVTLSFIGGSYSYSRHYYEDDLKNIYNSARYPFDFTSFSLTDNLQTDLSGFTMKFGLLYRFGKQGRFGLTVKTPSWLTLRETFSSVGTSNFDNGDQYQYPSAGVGPDHNEYDVRTPFIFSGGLAFDLRDLTLAFDVDYTDWTQMQFSQSGTSDVLFAQYLETLNTQVKERFNQTANVRVGGEYNFSDAGFKLRAGFMYLPSPYKIDSSPNNQKYATGGIGFTIENALGIDIGYAHGWWETSHINYDYADINGKQLSETHEMIQTNNLIGTVSYRF